jgi:hypothetical protein
MSFPINIGTLSNEDVRNIDRIARKKPIQKISNAVLEDLDRDSLARMISAYMVLKANGHTDADFLKYLTTKETKKVLKLGFGAAGAMLPSLLTDGEFRSLIMNTRKQMKRQKEEKEEEQREPQRRLEQEPKNETKVGPVKVTARPRGFVIESSSSNENRE